MDRLAFKCGLVLLFLRFSFLHETITYLTGINTYVLYIFGPIAFIGVFATGGLQRTFRENIAKYWLCFVIWMSIAVIFSSWHGGSLAEVLNYVRTNACMLLITAGLARTWKDCKQMIGALAAAALFNLVTAHYFVQTTTSGDRLALSWEGTIANSNDLAAHLLLVLPFWLFYLIKPVSNTIIRVIAVGALSVGLFTVLHTGSRGALVALVVTVLFVLITGSMKQRVALAILTPLAAVALLSLIPASTWNRLTSFSESSASSAEAIESSQSRAYLFQKSLLFTLQRPVFGVGPGQFSSYEGSTEVSQGERGNWHETHNSYTQVSSECGIPALIFYLLALFSTFGLLRKIKKKATEAKQQEIVTAVFCITIALVAYSTATAFVSFAYRFYLPAISGLVIAIWRALPDPGLVKVVAQPRAFRATGTNERVLT